jgi:hypothetical protein
LDKRKNRLIPLSARFKLFNLNQFQERIEKAENEEKQKFKEEYNKIEIENLKKIKE